MNLLRILLNFFIILTLINFVVASKLKPKKPRKFARNGQKVFSCEHTENTCTFKNITLTTTDYDWEPEADEPDLIDTVTFVNSVIPVVTNNICKYFVSLRQLNINGQQVEELKEDAFQGCSALTRIQLQNNKISQIPNKTFSNENIYRLYLDGNRFEKLDSWVTELENLTLLSLNDNNLTEIDVNMLKNNLKLKYLYVQSNELADLDVETLIENHPKLKAIHIDDNEIACVRLVEIIKFLHEKEIATGSFSNRKVRYYNQMGVFNGFKCNGDVEWMASNNRKGGLSMKSIIKGFLDKEESIELRLIQNEVKLDKLLTSLMSELNEQTKIIQNTCPCLGGTSTESSTTTTTTTTKTPVYFK